MVDSERNEMYRHQPPPRDPLADVDMDWRASRQEMLLQWAQVQTRVRQAEQLRRERRE